jgi:hypothetical protein
MLGFARLGLPRGDHALEIQVMERLAPFIGLVAGDFLDEVDAHDALRILGSLDEAFGVEVAGRDDAFLGPVLAQVAGQSARVDALDTDDVVFLEVIPRVFLMRQLEGCWQYSLTMNPCAQGGGTRRPRR